MNNRIQARMPLNRIPFGYANIVPSFTPERIAAAGGAETLSLYDKAWQALARKDYDTAIAGFNQMLREDPMDLGALDNVAFCLLATGRVELAQKSYELALQLAPTHTGLQRGLANCLESTGDFAAAAALYRRLLAQDPKQVEWLYNLVLIEDLGLTSPEAQQLLALHRATGLDHRSRRLVCFALAKLSEAHGEHHQAFDYYEEGNRLAFAASAYDETAFFDYLDRIETVFDAAFFARYSANAPSTQTPIFVLGMPRSGTSLVEQILASHPDVHGAGELHTIPDLVTRLIPRLTGSADPAAIGTLTTHGLETLARHYLKVARSHCPDKPYIVDKMPANLFHLGLIRLLFPQARIIHCVRDPMDTCWSLYRQCFDDAHHYSFDQRSLGRFYRRYQQLMQHWHRVMPGAILEVCYEDLIRTPQTAIAQLLADCGLTWHEGCLDFHTTDRTVSTASMRQVRQPLYQSALQSWKPVEDRLGELRDALGLSV